MSGDSTIGVHQSGGGITGPGPVAAVPRARIGVVPESPEPPTPVQALAALRLLLSEYGRALTDEDRARARGEMAEVGEHLVADPPDPGRLSRALDRLSAALASVAALAAGAATLREAVTRVFG